MNRAAVMQRIRKSLSDAGINENEAVIIQDLGLTNIPDDNFMTGVFLAAAEKNAENIESNFKCHICGTEYDHEADIVNCINNHCKDFLAGIPVKRDPEQIDNLSKQLPPEWREEFKKNILENQK